ncbi:MAG: class I SAM-dependent methyltransferase [Gammaproteobacteria bacterium]|nr:class I SAM-dependent methyltransferase [Gammaproteobacteria bacterium]
MANNSYDELPYDNLTHQFSHPTNTAVIARLKGLETPDIGRCRVLEIGCAAGANLLPLAMAYPDSEFVGVDLSGRQIEDGKKIVSELQLKNTELRQANLMEIDESWGKFDYIICHGVFSWVPEEVQEGILALCRRSLSSQGVAMISYNALPGWRLNQVVRDMLLFHTKQHEGSEKRVQQARAMLEFLATNAAGQPNDAYQALIGEVSKQLGTSSDAYLAHEYLEPHNTPVYFHEFAGRADAAGMQYLGDCRFGTMLDSDLPEATIETLRGIGQMEKEQYLDFLRNRRFRMSLLCHKEVTLKQQIDPQTIRHFHISLAKRENVVKHYDAEGEKISVRLNENNLTPSRAMTYAMLEILLERWPNPIAFGELHEMALSRLNIKAEQAIDIAASTMADDLMRLYIYGVVRIEDKPVIPAAPPSDNPVAYPLARIQARMNDVYVTNVRQDTARIDAISKLIIQQLDGTMDTETLVRFVHNLLRSGKASAHVNNKPVDPKTIDERQVRTLLDTILKRLGEMALLLDHTPQTAGKPEVTKQASAG